MEKESYFVINDREFKELLKLTSGKLIETTKLKRFGGKKIWIDGNLDISGLPVSSLGNIAYINGNLNMQNTNIASLSGVKVTGYVSDYGSKMWKIEQARILAEKKQIQRERKDNGDWDPENYDTMDDIGIMANALIEYFKYSGDYEVIDEEILSKLQISKNRLELLYQEQKDKEEKNEDTEEIDEEITSIEDEIMEIESEYIDVYELYPEKYDHWGMKIFTVLGDLQKKEFAIIEESEIDQAVMEYAKNSIDDLGLDGFNSWVVESCIDRDEVREIMERFYDDDIRENPESYFNEDDFELTVEQEKRIQELDDYIEELDDYIQTMGEEQSELENEIEDPDEYSKKYDEIQNLIDDAEKKRDDAQEELDSIEPDDEPTEEMINNKTDQYVEDRMDDIKSWLYDFGFNIKNYIDKDCVAQEWVNSDGYGIMNSYDGNYDDVLVNGTRFIVMRIN